MRKSEYSAVKAAHERLRAFRNLTVATEIPLLDRTVDLAYLVQEDVVTIEFKVKDWRQALRQSLDHLLGADFVIICLTHVNSWPIALVEAAKTHGIGLVKYCESEMWPFELRLRPKRSKFIWEPAREQVSKAIRENSARRTGASPGGYRVATGQAARFRHRWKSSSSIRYSG